MANGVGDAAEPGMGQFIRPQEPPARIGQAAHVKRKEYENYFKNL